MSDPAQLIREQFGPMLISLVFVSALGGFTIVQALIFLRTSKHDPLLHKLVVYFILILDTLHVSFLAYSVYHYLISKPGDTSLLWSLPALILVPSIMAPIIQLLYIARIWKLTPWSRIYLPGVLTLMALAHLVIGLLLSGTIAKYKSFGQAILLISNGVTRAYFAMRACSDFFIAGSMIFSLAHTGTNPKWTNSNLTMLLAYLLNTGVIASFLSFVLLAIVIAKPTSLTFLAVEEIAIKFYVNSFMGMLNARHYLQSYHHTRPSTTFFLQSEASSHIEAKDKIQGHPPVKTINEVGLPLFKLESTKSETDDDIRMEVMVKQEAHQSMD